MAFLLPEVGIAGVVAMFAIREIASIVKNSGNNKVDSKRCIDHDSMQRNFQNNAMSSATMIRVEVLLQKLLESSIEQVILLKSLNGKRKD